MTVAKPSFSFSARNSPQPDLKVPEHSIFEGPFPSYTIAMQKAKDQF
jgi:hypothetical protein